ncbi:hypothetical protein [Streptomyces sp. NPDC056549]|uniref:hypothetical protein n=1 Tax=Streptomyces sp. NPDC056549 TaxID=3345864 RepID=UPI003685B2D9
MTAEKDADGGASGRVEWDRARFKQARHRADYEFWPDRAGPQRLRGDLDAIRTDWLARGELPVRGARGIVRPDRGTILVPGGWHTHT